MSEPINPLELSDEEFAKLDIDTTVANLLDEEEKDDPVVDDTNTDNLDGAGDNTDDPGVEDENENSNDPGEGGNLDPEGEEEKDEVLDDDPKELDDGKPDDVVDDAKADKPKDTDTSDTDAVDYKAEYQKLLAPFQANGRTMNVHNVDEAIALMQMGANYNKKMAGLKPVMKLTKMLENNGLFTEEKLTFLIDLSKHDKDAINKLVNEAGLQNFDIDPEKATDYNPNTYTVDDKEVEMSEVLNDIRSTPTYASTLDILTSKWDEASRALIQANPQVVKHINDQVASGIFDKIWDRVEREQTLGRLRGQSDIEAYYAAGKLMQAEAGTVHPDNANAAPTNVEEKSKQSTISQRRKAAATPKTSPGKKASIPEDYNPLALSDEEFLKIATPKF